MKETPLLFTGPMVRAIIAGTKTQTRRPIKDPEYWACLTGDCPHWKKEQCAAWINENSPYHKRLWVKETFAYIGAKDRECDPLRYVRYRAENKQQI